MNTRHLFLVVPTLLLCSANVEAQFDDQWARFELDPSAIVTASPISDDAHETDLAWGDVDGDGDIDLIVVRKEPFTTEGRRTNVLLLNENGVLVDRTAELAAASDVPGDSGFLTPTNDRDVELVDLTGDGLPEIVTAPEQVTGQPKWISHPRVYLNLGLVDGAWQGFRHEDARFPQLFHNESGIPLDPRFMAVASGDLNGDGHADLYFGDHDTGTTLFGALQPASEDTDDRVLYNDGNGFFTDVSTSAMTPTMLASTFCNSVEIGDFNDDGAADVLKQITYSPPLAVRIAYGDTANPGAFGVQTSVSPKSPYFVESGDLNADGRLDVVVVQNDDDFFVVNLGNGPDGLASFSPALPFELLVGSEPVGATFPVSYSSNTLIADLDGDGWSEVLIADVDPEVNVYSPDHRLHFYHNRGGTIGGDDVVLREERGSPLDTDWIGAVGLSREALRWTHDVAVFDVDGDGDQDLILSRREGTQVWRQVPTTFCQADLGFGTGPIQLEVCGGELALGESAVLRLFDGVPNATAWLATGPAANPTPLVTLGVTLVPDPAELVQIATDAQGQFELSLSALPGPLTVVVQGFQFDGPGTTLTSTSAIQIEF